MKNVIKTERHDWTDIQFIVIATYYESSIDFLAYELMGHAQDEKSGKFDIQIFEKKGATSSEDTTENIEEAQTAIDATIKWDACSHVEFGDEDGYMHVCGGFSWRNLIEVQKRIFNLARDYFQKPHQKEMFDEFDEEI